MALFKISRGLKEKLPTTKTSGHCWYTVDDSMFYIDYEDENGEVQRKALNAKDAETITGASLATILNSSDIEIPTSKAVLDAISTKVSFAGVQTLTDEQKAQARENIGVTNSDWNQNDPTAPDYVKNRPFYESSDLEVISECEISSISSNSYTGGSKLHGGNVSLPSAEYIYGKEYIIEINGETHVMSLTQQEESQTGCNIIGFNIDDEVIAHGGNPTFNADVLFGLATFPSMPLLSDGDTFTTSLTVYLAQTVSLPATIRVGLEAETLVQIDPKYLPDSVKAQSDWNQNDETAPDYIKNKPEIATDDDAMDLLAELQVVNPVATSDGSVLTSSTGEIYIL